MAELLVHRTYTKSADGFIVEGWETPFHVTYSTKEDAVEETIDWLNMDIL